MCEGCQTINHHTIDACQLDMACMFDGNAEAASTELSQPDKRYRPQAPKSPCRLIEDGTQRAGSSQAAIPT